MRKAKNELWIDNALLVTQDSRRSVFRGSLRIVDGKIDSILKKTRRASSQVRCIDAQGSAILPGFVQAHVHLCQTLFRNQADDLELLDWLSKKIWVLEAAHTFETLHTSALLGLYELLSTGTTCVLDMGTVRHTDAIFEAVRLSGIRASVGKCLMDNPKTCPEGLCENTERALKEAVEIYEKWNETSQGRIRASYAPRFVISCTEQLLTEVAKLSKSQNAIVHTHSSENQKETALVRKLVGCENIEYLHRLGLTSPRLVLAHCIWLSENEKNILKNTHTQVVHCPSSNLKLASGIAPVPELRAMGINVALGADGAPCNNNLNMFTEMRLASLIHKPGSGPRAMRAQEVLDMATRDGAHALGWWDQIGSIEVGKSADLIALDLWAPENRIFSETAEGVASSVVYSTQSNHLQWSMVQGRMLYRGGKVKTIPKANLLEIVKRSQQIIRKRSKVF